MAQLPSPITLEVWGTNRRLEFATTESLTEWADRQSKPWRDVTPPEHNTLQTYWTQQGNQFANLANETRALEQALDEGGDQNTTIHAIANFNDRTSRPFDQIRRGTLITSDHPRFDDILALSHKDTVAAALLLVTAYSNGRDLLREMSSGQTLPFDTLIRQALSPTSYDGIIERHREEIIALKNKLDSEISSVQAAHAAWIKELDGAREAATTFDGERKDAWDTQLGTVAEQWATRLKTYDEKMALAAPTTYWRNRATWSMRSAIAYGLAFVGFLAWSMTLFMQYAIPHLNTHSAPDTPTLTAVLPVLIPAFAGVWILRILGRLLSESIKLMQDAREREVMAMTFLALMNDEVRGKALVTDDDRLLILHSLFRPSSIATTDDAPPVHWFDILSRKFGGPK